MTNSNHYAVIMAGGIGSRFWPVSTSKFPKQFHDLLGSGQTLLQTTFSRMQTLVPSQNIQVLTNERYLPLVLEQLPKINAGQTVLEPAMRNTAPCILLAALKIYKQNPDGIMLVAPSDHWIEGTTAFKNDISLCFQTCAARDILMTLGIKPTFPNTGYGYIETETRTNNEIKKVLQFREKPDYGTAQQFVQNGNFLWNAGIFIWSAKSIIAAFKKSLPHMYALFHKGHSTWNTPSEKQFIASEYEKAQNISIDFGILEKAKNVFVKQATFSWNDLGTWRALHDKLPKDKAQNTVVRAKTQLRDATDNIIFTQKEKLVVVEGLHDYIIVEKDNVLLIFPKQKEQEIKKLVSEISGTFGTTYN